MVEIYITVNWDGKASRGEAADAILIYNPDTDSKQIKVYGFKNVSYPLACALAVTNALRLVDPCDVKMITEDAYTFTMMQKTDFSSYKNREIWEEFARCRDKMPSFTFERIKDHRFKSASIYHTEKGGYKMYDVGK